MCNQISIILDMYKTEQYKRQQENINSSIKKQNKELDELINIE